MVLLQISGGRPEHYDAQDLVGYADVVPDGAECHLRHDDGHREHRQGNQKAVFELGLIFPERLGNGEARAAESRVARGDGAGNDADDGQHGTDLAQPMVAYFVDKVGRRVPRGDEVVEFAGVAKIVDGHRSPDERHDALGNHGAVENGQAVFFVLDGARHQRRLRAVKS